MEIEVKWDERRTGKKSGGGGKENCLSLRRKVIQQGPYWRTALENGTAVISSWGRKIETGAPTRAVS